MIYIYGDSHAHALFKNLKLPNHNLYQTSVTMHRIGRDNIIVGFDSNSNNENSTICFIYGEIDCRCHIHRQIELSRLSKEDDIINELVDNYMNTIKNNITKYKHIIIVAVPPPVARNDFEEINGKITHEYPILGNDEDRVRYTTKINQLLEIFSNENHYTFLDPFNYYKNENQCLNYTFSDKNIHIGDNTHFLNCFYALL